MMPSLHGAGDEGAVVDALAVVVPGVLMRVELHQRQRAVHGGVRLEQRPGDEMIAAERHQESAALQDPGGLALDRAGRLLVVADVEQAVAVVDHRQRLEQVAVERILRVGIEDRRGPADRLRAETGARPVGDGGIERDAPHDRVGALHVLGIFAPHEGQRPGIGRIARNGRWAFRGERMVDRSSSHRAPPVARPPYWTFRRKMRLLEGRPGLLSLGPGGEKSDPPHSPAERRARHRGRRASAPRGAQNASA